MRYVVIIWTICLMSCNRSTINTQFTGSGQRLKSEEVKLSNPVLSIDSLIFRQSALLELEFGLSDSKVFYKKDDGEFQEYNHPFLVSESCMIFYYAQKEGYQDSNISQIQLIKSTNLLEGSGITLNPLPDDNYPGNGAYSLNDLEKGKLNFRTNNAWCGFQSKIVEININFEIKQQVNKVILSILEDHESWIFAPLKIQVFIDNQLIEEKALKIPTGMSMAKFLLLDIVCKETSGKNIKLIIENVDTLPNWHPGSGSKPWFFIDEILVE